MYFQEKGDTNIDDEFDSGKKINIDSNKLKTILLITGGILLLAIIIFIIISIVNNSSNYTIELSGDEKITIAIGNNYIEPGYTAYDKDNNDVTSKVKVTNNVDTSIEGEYDIVYSIGNETVVRYVIVTEEISKTYIYLKGKKEMFIEIGEKYNEPGYIVYDSNEQNLTDKVNVTGKIDNSKVGTYRLTYSITNSKNETVEVQRIVKVVEKGKKTKN